MTARRCNHALLTAQIVDGVYGAIRYRDRWELFVNEMFVRYADEAEARQLDEIVRREAL